jgi:outer membrane protein assembly factor BamB
MRLLGVFVSYVAAAYGNYYQETYDGDLSCYDAETGATKWRTFLGENPDVPIGHNVVLIKGTVTDQSAGARGTPAIADEHMSAWMEYLYQQPMPTDATCVEVTIDAVDPNNNFIHIGTAKSDTSGLYSYAWTTPNVPGKYTIITTLMGSESYYASYSETAMVVSEAPAATPTR